jgi:hypothetical protein
MAVSRARRAGSRWRRLDSQLELRGSGGGLGGGFRGWRRGCRLRRARGLTHELAVHGRTQLAHLALGLRRLRFDVALEGTRGAFELALHLAELGELHLAADVRLHLGHVALQPSEEDPGGARHLRQALGADDHERDHADHEELGESDVEHARGERGRGG